MKEHKRGWKWKDNSKHRNSMYVHLDDEMKKSLQYFKGCHDRVRDGKSPSIQYPRNLSGFIEWYREIGPYPENLIKPSVGRKEHNRGYEAGNIQWEEHRVNSVKRHGTRHEFETSTIIELKNKEIRRQK